MISNERIYVIICAKEKQASAEQAFVFPALLTSKQSAEQTRERRMRGFASVYSIKSKRHQMIRGRT